MVKYLTSFGHSGPVWSANYTEKQRKAFYDIADKMLSDKTQKDTWVGCTIYKAKLMLPGGLEAVSDGVRNDVLKSIGDSCMSSIKGPPKMLWSPEIVAGLKEFFLSMPVMKNVKADKKDSLCDCYISSLKTLYPNGIIGKINTDTIILTTRVCLSKAKDRHWFANK